MTTHLGFVYLMIWWDVIFHMFWRFFSPPDTWNFIKIPFKWSLKSTNISLPYILVTQSQQCHRNMARLITHTFQNTKSTQQKHFVTRPRQSRRMKSACCHFSARPWWSESSKHTERRRCRGDLTEHKSHSSPVCLSHLTSHNPLVRFDALHTRHLSSQTMLG